LEEITQIDWLVFQCSVAHVLITVGICAWRNRAHLLRQTLEQTTPLAALPVGVLWEVIVVWGPPANETHIREWNFDEFHRYIGIPFNILDHIISNREQFTQMIVCTLK
jgi:hypothetical protein